MTVKRIESLDIRRRSFFTAIVGNTDDVFIDNDLCLYTFEEQLCLYLRIQGYDHVYFYSRARKHGLYSYDGQRALQWLFADDSQQTAQNQVAADDGRPLGRTSKFRKRSGADNSNNHHIKQEKKNKHTYWHADFMDTTLTGQIIKILGSQSHKSVICFLSTEFVPKEAQGLINGIERISSTAAVEENPNKMLIIYGARDADELYKNHFENPNTKFFNSDFFANQFRKGNMLNMENIFLVDVPDEAECKNWINYQRIVRKSLSGKTVFSFPYEKLAKQICKQKKRLSEWNKEDVQDPKFIESLKVVEFSEGYLRDALSHIHGQEDNISVIVDQVITFVNDLEYGVNRPLVFMFAGTSGTGKTYTAETIAKALESRGFGFLPLDMNTYLAPTGTSKLLGSATGYVGSEQDSPIFAARKEHDRLVILFDEIDKADPVLFRNLMTLLDKGFLSNGRGEQFDFRESIIVFTTNLCMEQLTQKKAELRKAKVDTASYKFQRETKQIIKNGGVPNEVSGRIGCLLVYNPLSVETVARIAIEEIRKLGAKYNVRVNNIPESLLRDIAQETAKDNEGARPIRDFVERELKRKIQQASRMLNQ